MNACMLFLNDCVLLNSSRTIKKYKKGLENKNASEFSCNTL